MTLLADIAAQARAQTPLEVVAVFAAVMYLLLAIRQNIYCWLFAGISTAAYVWVFFDARLYMESVLNVFYFGMAIYGWLVWSDGRSPASEKAVVSWPLRVHIIAIGVTTTSGVTVGAILYSFTDAAFPFIDSLTTGFAIWATFLVAQKVLENWWYWLAIDLVSILIFWSRGLELSSLLFLIYVIMIPFGLLAWKQSMHGKGHAVGRKPRQDSR